MTKVMPPPANMNTGPSEIEDAALDEVTGAAETVHLYLKSNGEDVQGESAAHIEGYEVTFGTRIGTEGSTHKSKPREIVVVGSKVKDVVR